MNNDPTNDWRYVLNVIRRNPRYYKAAHKAFTVYITDTVTGVCEYSYNTPSLESAVRIYVDAKSTFASAAWSAFCYDVARRYIVCLCVDSGDGLHTDLIRKEVICHNA